MPEINEKAANALIAAEAFAIETSEQFISADQMCAGLKDLEREIGAGYDEQIKQAHDLHKSLIAKKNAYLTPVEAARKILKQKMAAWQFKKDQERQELERQLQEQLKKKAEDDALAAAAEAEKARNKAQAEAIIAAPVFVQPVALPSQAPKTQTKFQTRWTFRIVNADLIPRQYLKPDEVTIGRVVTALKGAAKIAGIEVFSRTV